MDFTTVANVFFVVFSTLMGIVIGSFLNVIIYRIPEGRTVVKGHSMCMTCGHELGALDLVPVLSWLCLGGKCRYCKAPISSRYIKIESFTGLVFLLFSLTHISYQLDLFDPLSKTSLIFFSIYCISLIMLAALISSMMIYHDTKKSFVGYSIFLGIGALIFVALLVFVIPFKTVGILFLRSLGIMLAGALITAVFCIVFKKKYSLADLWLDLPYVIFYSFFCLILSSKLIFVYIAFLVLFVLPRCITKASKIDKFTAIFSTCGILVTILIGYFI